MYVPGPHAPRGRAQPGTGSAAPAAQSVAALPLQPGAQQGVRWSARRAPHRTALRPFAARLPALSPPGLPPWPMAEHSVGGQQASAAGLSPAVQRGRPRCPRSLAGALLWPIASVGQQFYAQYATGGRRAHVHTGGRHPWAQTTSLGTDCTPAAPPVNGSQDMDGVTHEHVHERRTSGPAWTWIERSRVAR